MEYHARHILVRTDGNAADDAKAKATADTLRARLAGGADFAALARSNSEDPNSAPRGGDLGWFVQDGYGDDFGKHMAALKPDETSQPFRTNAGWHIVQLLGTRETDVGTQTRREQIRDMIGRRKLEEQWNRFLREMRDEAFVEIRLDGATATPASAGSAG
jgi:peptidyl-prolyl cis-trans isomerase SurA